MAASHPSPGKQSDRPDGPLAAIVKARRIDGASLLPGALALLGFHILVVGSGALGRVQPIGQLVLAVSLASVAVSSILFAVPVLRAQVLHRVEGGLRAAVLLFAAGMAALAIGLGGDFFVLGTQLTRSTTAGELLAGVVLVLVYAPWL